MQRTMLWLALKRTLERSNLSEFSVSLVGQLGDLSLVYAFELVRASLADFVNSKAWFKAYLLFDAKLQ